MPVEIANDGPHQLRGGTGTMGPGCFSGDGRQKSEGGLGTGSQFTISLGLYPGTGEDNHKR
jgi:hypothetical protein